MTIYTPAGFAGLTIDDTIVNSTNAIFKAAQSTLVARAGAAPDVVGAVISTTIATGLTLLESRCADGPTPVALPVGTTRIWVSDGYCEKYQNTPAWWLGHGTGRVGGFGMDWPVSSVSVFVDVTTAANSERFAVLAANATWAPNLLNNYQATHPNFQATDYWPYPSSFQPYYP